MQIGNVPAAGREIAEADAHGLCRRKAEMAGECVIHANDLKLIVEVNQRLMRKCEEAIVVCDRGAILYCSRC